MADEVIDLAESDIEEDNDNSVKKPSAVETNESIDLCDSSDDEEEDTQEVRSAAVPCAKAAETSINLCDSSDDEDVNYPNETKTKSSEPKKAPASALKSRAACDISQASSDDDDDLLNQASVFARKPVKNNKPVSLDRAARSTSDVVSLGLAHRSASRGRNTDGGKLKAARKPAQPNAAVARKPPRRLGNADDSSDDDDDILNYTSGLTIRRSSSSDLKPAAAARSPATSPPSVSKPRAVVVEDKPFPYPTLLSTSKLYPDQRARFALAFWKYGRSLTRNSFHRPKLDSVAKRVVRLAVSEYPVRSLEEYVSFGKTSVTNARQIREEVLEELNRGDLNQAQTPVTTLCPGRRRFYTISEACLVTLLEQVESRQKEKGVDLQMKADSDIAELLKEKGMWVSLENLIPLIDGRLLPQSPGRLVRRNDLDFGASHYLEQSTRSIEFLQISKLETSLDDAGARIKRHMKGGKPYYELLPSGYRTAVMVRSRPFPAPPGHYRCSKIATVSQVQECYRGICLAQDSREGGGGAKTLHLLCNKLDMMQVPFLVGSLSIGDYAFFTSKDGGKRMDSNLDYLCPIIIERKSVQDVAQSIHDGRWTNQKRRMYQAQYVFGYDNCRMVYIIEGNENAQTVSGDYVGARWFNVDKEKLNEEIDNLKAEGFEVMRTPSKENTMFELSRWAKQIAAELKSGIIKPRYTYAEFKRKVAEIPRQTDFSRLAKDHMQQKLATTEASEVSSKRVTQDDDSDIEVLSDLDTSSAKKPPKKRQKQADDEDKYSDMPTKELKAACQDVGLPKSGKRDDLIARLRGPHPPELWLKRKRRGEYVPSSYDVGGTALLVALYLHEKDLEPNHGGLTKDELYVKAESLNITKNPFSGGTTQTGPYHYDGWSSMGKLKNGDPALVVEKKGKFKLTRSCDMAGYSIAEAMHTWCHEHNNCPCGDPLGL